MVQRCDGNTYTMHAYWQFDTQNYAAFDIYWPLCPIDVSQTVRAFKTPQCMSYFPQFDEFLSTLAILCCVDI